MNSVVTASVTYHCTILVDELGKRRFSVATMSNRTRFLLYREQECHSHLVVSVNVSFGIYEDGRPPSGFSDTLRRVDKT